MKTTWLYRLTPPNMAHEWHGVSLLGPVPFLIMATSDRSRVVLRMVTPCCTAPLVWLGDDLPFGCDACELDYTVSALYAASASHDTLVKSEGVLEALDAWNIDPLTATMLEAEARSHLVALQATQQSSRGVKATDDPELARRVCLVLAQELRREVERGV